MGMKKKLSKKEKARLEAEQAELLRIEMEKEKQRKLEEERKRKQHEREEAEKRQKLEIIENRARRAQLKESVCYFEGISQEIETIKDEAKRQSEWEHYMRCNGLPSASNPGDLRKYVHMWYTSVLENKSRERNWLLKTNERTILTQDKTIIDLTREALRKNQPNLGDLYSQRIQEVLGVLKELDLNLQNTTKLSENVADDLKSLKWEIRVALSDFIDDFTFRILSHVERDMEYSASGMSEHVYDSSVFRTQVWMIQADAQKTQNKDKFKDNNKHSVIEYPLLKLQLTLPESFKLLNSAVRGLWLNYDHFSDYCPSFQIPCPKAKSMHILHQTKKEWKKRKEIIQSTLEQVTKETHAEGFDSSEEMPRRVIDVDKLYTEYEDEINKARRKSMGPEALNLIEFDINLRSHRIVGGLYCIDWLEQPQQDKRLNNTSFIRSITLPNKLTRKAFFQPYKPPPAPLPGVRRLPEEIEAEMKAVERNLDRLVTITLELPDTVLWFEPPIVCHWETPQEMQEVENDPNDANASLGTRKSVTDNLSRKKSLSRLSDKPQKNIQDFDMYNIPTTVDLFGVMIDFVVPRLPDGYCIAIQCFESANENSEGTSYTKYLSKDTSKQAYSSKALIVRPITEQIIETHSPRPLHVDFTFDKILQIIRKSEKDYSDERTQYMFSKFIEDLEQLCESKMPYQNERLLDTNSKLSSARSSNSDGVSNRRFSNVIIVHEADILRKGQSCIQPIGQTEDEDSGSEFDGDDEEHQEYNEATEKGTSDQNQTYHGRWSTRDVHDTKFNEDKLSIQFRTGRLGFFGFAANRYSNMPYQTWEIKPDFKSPIIFTLTAAVVSLEIQITSKGFRVNMFQGGSTEYLSEMIGQLFSLERLKEILTNAAVDIFPEDDAFCYTEGSCEKNYVMEMHLYACMASLALSHNFSWSRWNLLSGRRAAVLLMREIQEGKKVPNHSTLFVTPLRASIVECTEVSASFSTAGVAGMEFYADLYHLAQAHSLESSKDKQAIMDPVLRDNIFELLNAVRPLSFC